jgi:hypothetical protein
MGRVHIDGAFGLWAKASPRLRHLVADSEHAGSWATDDHKWLNVPYDCGYTFVAAPQAQRATMSYQASYLMFDMSTRDQIDWNPEWSRRARGFSTYRCSDRARVLTLGIGRLPGAEVLWTSLINQGSGAAFFGRVTWRGKRTLRMSVCNWMTAGRDVDRVIAAFARIPEAPPQ